MSEYIYVLCRLMRQRSYRARTGVNDYIKKIVLLGKRTNRYDIYGIYNKKQVKRYQTI